MSIYDIKSNASVTDTSATAIGGVLSACTSLNSIELDFTLNALTTVGGSAIGTGLQALKNVTDLLMFFQSSTIGDTGL